MADELTMTYDELADVVISTVQQEPTQPTNLGMHTIIAGLFQQVADKAKSAERERIAQFIADERKAFAEMEADFHDPDDILAPIERFIREGK